MHLVILTQVLDREDAVLGFFHRWCEVFAEEVEQLTVFAHDVGDVDLPDHVRVVSLGRDRGRSRVGRFVALQKGLWRLTGADRPDALWVHMVPRLGLFAAPVALLRRIPLFLWYTHKGVDRNLRMVVRLVQKVFTASEESFRLTTKHAQAKTLITGHGIDCDVFRPGTKKRSVDVVCLGRIAPSKGQAELLEALELLSPCPSTKIVGDILLQRDIPYRDKVSDRAGKLGEAVGLTGALSHEEIPQVLSAAKVLVNASRTGSVDKVVLEAMACGTIPVTCNEAFLPVLGEELGRQLMYRRGNPKDLARVLGEVFDLEEKQRSALGKQLRQIVTADHDLKRLIPSMVEAMAGGEKV